MVDKKAKGKKLRTAPTAIKCGPRLGFALGEPVPNDNLVIVQVVDPRHQLPTRKEQKPL